MCTVAPYLENISGQNNSDQNISGPNAIGQNTSGRNISVQNNNGQNTSGRVSMPGPDVRCSPISGDQHHSRPLCLSVDRYSVSITHQKDANSQNRTLCLR